MTNYSCPPRRYVHTRGSAHDRGYPASPHCCDYTWTGLLAKAVRAGIRHAKVAERASRVLTCLSGQRNGCPAWRGCARRGCWKSQRQCASWGSRQRVVRCPRRSSLQGGSWRSDLPWSRAGRLHLPPRRRWVKRTSLMLGAFWVSRRAAEQMVWPTLWCRLGPRRGGRETWSSWRLRRCTCRASCRARLTWLSCRRGSEPWQRA